MSGWLSHLLTAGRRMTLGASERHADGLTCVVAHYPGGRAARCDEDSLGYESDKAKVMTHQAAFSIKRAYWRHCLTTVFLAMNDPAPKIVNALRDLADQ